MKLKLFLIASIGIIAQIGHAQTQVASKDAANHIGETIMVCDKVYSTKLITGSNMTLLNLGGYYPNQLLTVMIKGKDRSKFNVAPEVLFKDGWVCVNGKIVEYKGKPEIIVSDPSQIGLDPNASAAPTPKTKN